MKKLILFGLVMAIAACAAQAEKHLVDIEKQLREQLREVAETVRVIDRNNEAEISIVCAGDTATEDNFAHCAGKAAAVSRKVLQSYDLKLNILSVRFFAKGRLLYHWYTYDFEYGFFWDARRPAALYFLNAGESEC